MRRRTAAPTPRHVQSRGFTIVELLVVIAILGTLLGIIVPVLNGVRMAGRASAELAGARQLMTAFINYAAIYDDAALPGYDSSLTAKNASGQPIGAAPIRARYPWRIAPFLDYSMAGLYLNRHRETLEQAEQENEFLYMYLVSLLPSLGMNTMWIGGDELFGAFDPGSAFGRYYVTRLSQVRRTDRLITFASARGGDPLGVTGFDLHEGYFKVTSPYTTALAGPQWADEYTMATPPAQTGYLSPRYGDQLVIATVDGHVEQIEFEKLRDMQYWSNHADRPDWALEPQR